MASRQPARNAHDLLCCRLKAHAELHPEHHGVGHHPRAAGPEDVLHCASFVCLPVTVTKTSDHRLSFSTQRLLFRASDSLDRRPTGGAVGPRVSTGARWGARGWYSPVLLVHPEAVHAPCPPGATDPLARNPWRRKARRGAGAHGRAHVPTCPYPKPGRVPISWHGAGGLRRLGRALARAGGWSQISR